MEEILAVYCPAGSVVEILAIYPNSLFILL